MRILERVVKSLHVSQPEEVEEPTLRGDVDAVASVCERRRARFHGTLTSIVLRSATSNPRVEAELSDGTGKVTLVWMGRESIHGIEPGTEVEVSGFVGFRGPRRVMYNPRYAIHGHRDEDT